MNRDMSQEEVLATIKTLKKPKATALALEDQLLTLYQECWQIGVFPKVWKKATLVWIPKKDGILDNDMQRFLENAEQIDIKQYKQ